MEFAKKYKQNATFNEDLGCTQEQMMDMRNDARFSCYKLLTFDYSKDEVARERKLAKESMDSISDELEQERNVQIFIVDSVRKKNLKMSCFPDVPNVEWFTIVAVIAK